MLRHGFRTSAHDTHQPAATGCASSISRLPSKIRRQIPLKLRVRTRPRQHLNCDAAVACCHGDFGNSHRSGTVCHRLYT